MTLAQYVKRSKRDFPEPGEVGREHPDWLEVGVIEVTTGSLCVVDTTMFNADDGVVAKVPPGTYRVEGKGMDFEGHRRVSRMRVYLDGTSPSVGKKAGKVDTDSGSIAACDIEAASEGFDGDEEGTEELLDKLNDIDCDGGKVVRFKAAGRRIELAVCESGLGDGSYRVFALRDGRRTVGLEVEFLPPEFVAEE